MSKIDWKKHWEGYTNMLPWMMDVMIEVQILRWKRKEQAQRLVICLDQYAKARASR